jgi:copper resistance protein B
MNRLWLCALLICSPPIALSEESSFGFFQADRLEYQTEDEATVWDLQGWYGNDLHKLWWKVEGSDAEFTKNDVQLLYSRAITPWFDFQAGVLLEFVNSENTAAAIVGLQGMAPYGLELDVATFVTERGDVGLKAEAERDFYFTQKLVLQPRLEFVDSSAAASELDLGIRLRYEFSRQIAPYLGVSWHFSGNSDNNETLLAGLRFWF